MDDGESERAQTHEYTLGYDLWQCDPCGSQFVAMAGCQQCGKDGPQPDRLVDERRQIVQRLRPLLDAEHQNKPLNLQRFWSEIGGWLDRLYAALAQVGQSGQASEHELAAAINEVAELRSAARAAPRFRPMLGVWREVDSLLADLRDVAAANLNALAAATPEEAREDERSAQELIDAAAARAHSCAALLSKMGLPTDGSFFKAFARDTAAAYEASGAQSLLDFDAKGASLWQRVAGEADFPTGLGVSLMLINAKIDESFDADRFWRDARAAFLAFTGKPVAFEAFVSNEEWRERVARATRELFSLGIEAFDRAAEGVAGSWFENRAVLRLALGLAEGVAPIYFETLLALHERRDWEHYRGRDPGSVVNSASSAGFSSLVYGIDVTIRNAEAHRSYRQVDDQIVLMDRKGVARRQLRQEELVDQVLASLESCLLLHVALACAMTTRGVPAEDLDIASDLILRDDQLRFLASGAGIAEPEIERLNRRLVLTGNGSLAGQLALPTIAALSAVAGDDVNHLELRLRREGGTEWRAEGPLQPFRAFRASDGPIRECATVEAAASWRLSGEPAFSRTFVRTLGLLADWVRHCRRATVPRSRCWKRLRQWRIGSATASWFEPSRRLDGCSAPAERGCHRLAGTHGPATKLFSGWTTN